LSEGCNRRSGTQSHGKLIDAQVVERFGKTLELLYRGTEDDSVLGSIERSKAHLDEILHRSGMIFLIRSDGKTLLQRRSPIKATFPDCWDSSSSFHVTFGESYEQATRRELKGETGVSQRSRILESSRTMSRPENEIVAEFSGKSDDPFRLTKRNRLKHHSTQDTMLT